MPCNRPPSPDPTCVVLATSRPHAAVAAAPGVQQDDGPRPGILVVQAHARLVHVRHPNSPVMTWTESSHGQGKADAIFTVRTYGTRQLCDPGLARVQLWRPENVQLTPPSLHRTQEREPTQDNDAITAGSPPSDLPCPSTPRSRSGH
jgi:hypothetical protein